MPSSRTGTAARATTTSADCTTSCGKGRGSLSQGALGEPRAQLRGPEPAAHSPKGPSLSRDATLLGILGRSSCRHPRHQRPSTSPAHSPRPAPAAQSGPRRPAAPAYLPGEERRVGAAAGEEEHVDEVDKDAGRRAGGGDEQPLVDDQEDEVAKQPQEEDQLGQGLQEQPVPLAEVPVGGKAGVTGPRTSHAPGPACPGAPAPPLQSPGPHTWLKTPRTTPKVMWVTPRMTDIFILKELRKLRWLTARLQTWGGRREGCHAGDSLPVSLSAAPLPPGSRSTVCHPSAHCGAAEGRVRRTARRASPGPNPSSSQRGDTARVLSCASASSSVKREQC